MRYFFRKKEKKGMKRGYITHTGLFIILPLGQIGALLYTYMQLQVAVLLCMFMLGFKIKKNKKKLPSDDSFLCLLSNMQMQISPPRIDLSIV